NGAVVPKSSDPCLVCHCFYGKEICQEQKCPSPPSLGCVAEPKAAQCCPVYTCRMDSNTSSEADAEQNLATRNAASPNNHLYDQSPIRKSPQYQPDIVALQ